MNMPSLSLGLFGCGVMGQRHIKGLGQLHKAGLLPFMLTGVCDLVSANAGRAADLAESLLGVRPRQFESFEAMRAAVHIDAITLTTMPNAHTALGIEAAAAGVHVLCEKPVSTTVKDGWRMVRAMRAAGLTLGIAENYRRDPINRLARALIDAGAIGRPYLALQSSSGSGEHVIITPWRHLKNDCGIGVDMGVHYTDVLEYLLGPIDSVSGMSAVVDAQRKGADGAMFPADAADLLAGVLRFRSGAIANLMLDLAGRGAGHFMRMVYGDGGTLSIPQDRSGKALTLTRRIDGADIVVTPDELLVLVPGFALDAVTAALFGGARLTHYDLPWADTDANLIAIEYADFAEAIREKREPEVNGEDGLRSLALIYGLIETERIGRAASAEELLSGAVSSYQDGLS
jgi:predicted dehydrogenase